MAYAEHDLSAYAQRSETLQLIAVDSGMIITLPPGTGAYEISIGPIRTNGAEATTAGGGVYRFGDGSIETVPAFKAEVISPRRYMEDGAVYTHRVTRNQGNRPVRLVIATPNATDIVEISLDALEG